MPVSSLAKQVAVASRVDDVDARRDDRARRWRRGRCRARSRGAAPARRGRGTPSSSPRDVRADVGQVHRRLLRHAPDLEAAAEVHDGRRRGAWLPDRASCASRASTPPGPCPSRCGVCSRVIVRPWRSASALTSPRCSCQMPKLDAGPPVLVRLVDPLPSPGFMRTETARPGAARPKASSWCSEQALKSTPRAHVLGEPRARASAT